MTTVANKAASKRTEIPIYSFEKHARLDKTTSIYSPHVLILEGIFALYDPRVLEMLDMKVGQTIGKAMHGVSCIADSLGVDILRSRSGHLLIEAK